MRDVEVMRIRLLGGADPPVRGRPPGRPALLVRFPQLSPNYLRMPLYRRRLPHDYEADQARFPHLAPP